MNTTAKWFLAAGCSSFLGAFAYSAVDGNRVLRGHSVNEWLGFLGFVLAVWSALLAYAAARAAEGQARAAKESAERSEQITKDARRRFDAVLRVSDLARASAFVRTAVAHLEAGDFPSGIYVLQDLRALLAETGVVAELASDGAGAEEAESIGNGLQAVIKHFKLAGARRQPGPGDRKYVMDLTNLEVRLTKLVARANRGEG